MTAEQKLEPNVVARLKSRISDARGLGFKVRIEPLDGEQATWCEIGGIPTLFVDLSQTAAEQLQQIDETLAAFCQRRVPGLRQAPEVRQAPEATGTLASQPTSRQTVRAA